MRRLLDDLSGRQRVCPTPTPPPTWPLLQLGDSCESGSRAQTPVQKRPSWEQSCWIVEDAAGTGVALRTSCLLFTPQAVVLLSNTVLQTCFSD